MKAIEVRPVRTKSERNTFLRFPWRIYKDDPLWVPPLLSDRAETTDPSRGVFFQRGGEAEFFIAWRGEEPAGTICAAEDKWTNDRRGRRECMFGFFDCVDDADVAAALFKTVVQWARSRNLAKLFGPFNLDYEDSYGVLIEGRDRPPALLCGHTPPYYQRFFEKGPFQFYKARGDNLAFEIDFTDDSPDRQKLHLLADRLRQRGWIHVRGADFSHWQEEADRVYGIINEALKHLDDFIGWNREALHDTVKTFVRIADPELILFAEIDGKPVGWFPGVPNFYHALQAVNGARYPWDMLRLAILVRRKITALTIKSVLVLPEYWQTGVAVLMFDEMIQRARRKGYIRGDLSLTSEDNPYTPDLAHRLGAQIYKRYRTYRLDLE
ncbi:MAG: GNAT family N-acetyltransferase [Anaerolineales bacterium]|nr:GNAT family N-acetyltransferase [Anaerolineales bacterium]